MIAVHYHIVDHPTDHLTILFPSFFVLSQIANSDNVVSWTGDAPAAQFTVL